MEKMSFFMLGKTARTLKYCVSNYGCSFCYASWIFKTWGAILWIIHAKLKFLPIEISHIPSTEKKKKCNLNIPKKLPMEACLFQYLLFYFFCSSFPSINNKQPQNPHKNTNVSNVHINNRIPKIIQPYPRFKAQKKWKAHWKNDKTLLQQDEKGKHRHMHLNLNHELNITYKIRSLTIENGEN